MKTTTKLWIGLAVLIFLSPLGLLLPDSFKAGAAWGEWGSDEIAALVGYVPGKLERLSSLWSAPFPDYAFKGWEEKSLMHLSAAYIASALVGLGITVAAILLLGKLLVKKEINEK